MDSWIHKVELGLGIIIVALIGACVISANALTVTKEGIATVTKTELWACHVPEHTAKLVGDPRTASFRGRPIYVVQLSRMHTEEKDMVLIYPVVKDKVGLFPIYYIYDIDRDGRPDIAYADEMGNGICQQMTQLDPSIFTKGGNNDPRDDPKQQAQEDLRDNKSEPPAMKEGECHEGEGDSDNPKKEL